MTARVKIAALLALLVAVLAPVAALANVQSVYHGGTYVGSVIVEPGQVIQGDLTVIFGDATIEGAVNGDVNVVGGTAFVRPGAAITGQVNTVGGDVAGAVVPWAGTAPYRDTSGDYRLIWRIVWDLVAVLFFLIFPLRTRMAVDRLENHPGLCAAIGLVGWVAVIPLAILLLCTILLIPFIAVEAVAVIAGLFLGKAALALLVGRRLWDVLSPKTTPAPFAALIVGLALITAAELVPILGAVVMVFVALIGLGAAILAFSGSSFVGPRTSIGTPLVKV